MRKEVRKWLSLRMTFTIIVSVFVLSALLNVKAVSAQSTIIISPSGGDDTANIKDAFGQANQGDTIQLEAGKYEVTGTIYVKNFSGTFTGAGKNKSIITNNGEEVWPIFEFEDGDLTISSMSFKVTGEVNVCIFYLFGEFINTLIDDVGFEGEYYSSSGSNVEPGVLFGGSLDIFFGNHTVSNCSFDTVERGVVVSSTHESNVEVKNNIFFGRGNTALSVMLCNESSFSISRNTIDTHKRGIVAFRSSTSEIEIINNTITDTLQGILSTYTDNVDIVENNISSESASDWCIRSLDSNYGLCINNSCRGTYNWYAIGLRFSNDWIITGNRFSEIVNPAYGAIMIKENSNFVTCNDYWQSELPGWIVESGGNITSPGCVYIGYDSEDNMVAECLFPEGTTAYEQVRDLGINSQILTCSEGSIYLINELISEVESLVEDGKLNKGQGNSLIVELEGAIKQINIGNNQPACNILGAFINEVDALIRSGQFSQEEGQSLIDMANIVMVCLCG